MGTPWEKRKHYPRKRCAIDGCSNLTAPSGGRICRKHQWRWRHYKDYNYSGRTVEQRFWAKVDKSGECWLWTGACSGDGYGAIGVEGKQRSAHRVSFQLHNGAITEGMVVMHSCDQPKCVNPDHLSLGTSADNSADAARKGRRLPGSLNHNAKLDEERVLELRRRYAAGGISQKELARDYGISLALVSFIVTRKAWKHI